MYKKVLNLPLFPLRQKILLYARSYLVISPVIQPPELYHLIKNTLYICFLVSFLFLPVRQRYPQLFPRSQSPFDDHAFEPEHCVEYDPGRFRSGLSHCRRKPSQHMGRVPGCSGSPALQLRKPFVVIVGLTAMVPEVTGLLL